MVIFHCHVDLPEDNYHKSHASVRYASSQEAERQTPGDPNPRTGDGGSMMTIGMGTFFSPLQQIQISHCSG